MTGIAGCRSRSSLRMVDSVRMIISEISDATVDTMPPHATRPRMSRHPYQCSLDTRFRLENNSTQVGPGRIINDTAATNCSTPCDLELILVVDRGQASN